MRTCILLAGGLGTRVGHLTAGLQKCLTKVADRPFIAYIIDHLLKQQVQHFIVSLGYKAQDARQTLEALYPQLNITYVVENTPLGTGGAIKLSLQESRSQSTFVVNADTFFPVDLLAMESRFEAYGLDVLIAGKEIEKPDRYGTIEVGPDHRITAFREKAALPKGFINGGTYLVKNAVFDNIPKQRPFSFEKDFLENKIKDCRIHFFACDEPFIDIGVPKDFYKAQHFMAKYHSIRLSKALILDRDGVINTLIPNDYVRNWSMFAFRPGFLEFLSEVHKYFTYIFVVTNQQGIGKGLMTIQDLQSIHERMVLEIQKSGAFITKIYHCPHLAELACDCRKPKTGMLKQVMDDFPDVHWESSLLIGDSPSDIEMATAYNIPSVALHHDHNSHMTWEPTPVFTARDFMEIQNAVLPALSIC